MIWTVFTSPSSVLETEGGCGALVPRGEMEAHQQFACPQSCPNSKPKKEGIDGDDQDVCDVRLSRNDLIDHLRDHCKLRLVHCPHPSCEVSAQHKRMSAHLETCPYASVSCPLQCGATNLIRKSLEAHKVDCPRELVPCVHTPLGCSHVAPRCEIGQHEQDVGIHFISLSKAFVQLQLSHGQQINQMQETFKEKLQMQTAQFEERLKLQATSFEERLQAQVEEILQRIILLESESKKQAKKLAEAEETEAAKKLEEAAKKLAEAEETEAAKKLEEAAKKLAEARAGLKCYQCGQPATHLYRNNKEPQRADSYRINGFSGTCSSHIAYGDAAELWNKL